MKKALETREEMALQIRKRALFEFGKYGEAPEQIEARQRRPDAAGAVATIQVCNEDTKR